MREEAFKDTRLLDALEYIDDSYISSAARYKMKYEDKPEPVLTWKTPLKHWKALAALAACLLLLAFASPVVSYVVETVRSFAAGWGSEVTEAPESTDESVYNDVILELCKSCVDYSVLTPELIDEINSAWMKLDGKSEPLFETVDDLMYDTDDDERYLGVYNGYYVFAYTNNYTITGGSVLSVANHEFFIQGELIAYKAGEIIDLGEVYDRGEISYVDISEIHKKYYELYDYNTIKDHLRNVTEISLPQIPVQVLEEKDEDMIVNALYNCLSSIHGFDIEDPEIYITEYYGNYNGAYVFKYKTPSIAYDCFNYYYETVEGIDFLYRYREYDADSDKSAPGSGTRIYVYYNDAIYTLSEAYEMSLLTYDDIKTIKKYHTLFYPYALDKFIYEDVYLFPTKLE